VCNVSAIWASNANTGWQQVKMSSHRSSGIVASSNSCSTASRTSSRRVVAAPLVAEDLLDQRYRFTTGRTSIAPGHPSRGDPRRDLERRAEVVRLQQVEASEDLLGVGERAVRGHGLTTLDANGRRHLDGLQLLASDHALVLADGQVLAGDGPLFGLAQSLERVRGRVDQQCVLHVPSFQSCLHISRRTEAA